MTDLARRSMLAGGIALGATASWGPAVARLDSDGLRVSTRLGPIQGVMEDGVRVFKGVRYAQSERFRASWPVKPWSGVYNATRFGATAVQETRDTMRPGPMSEDCLFLNVWAPKTPGPHPVMVWLHGGGNRGGAGDQDAYNCYAFARDGVVGVTLNWRLASFGFVEMGHVLPQYAGSGNNALRDIILALRWVQANIADFGGDPSRVTLAGCLAGSRNVMALLSSPESKGLFHRAIAISTGAHTYHTPQSARTIANLVIDVAGGDPKTLTTMPAPDLVKAQALATSLSGNAASWRSTVDGELLPQAPIEMFKAGTGRDIPLLFGTVRDEATSLVADEAWKKPFPLSSKELQLFDLATLNDLDLRYQRALPDMKPLARRFRLIMGAQYWISCLRLAAARAALGAETYMYRFDRALTEGKYAGYTVSGMDVPYQFETLGRGEVVTTGAKNAPQDYPFSRTIHTAFVNFIKGGTPSAPGLPAWPSYALATRAPMILDYRSRIEHDPLKEERVLWSDVLV